ncbi:MAG: hypothetical protein GY862_24345 [Gammaproteobacteria bacterium]|nr:hypothetical protein [Gammaproteobacteria bacterium]
MSLTPEQIAKFEKALKGPAPAGDPNWAVTQQLLKLTVMQAREILSLQDQLEALADSNMSATNSLVTALRQGDGSSAVSSGLSQAQIDSAMGSLNQAIQNYRTGAKVMDYAGQVLKFAALFI